jgi:DNA-binding transcriptional MerR regulator
VIAPISRGASSGHRVYDDEDLDQLMWVCCLAATGMSVADMRLYMANNRLGAGVAADQERLLREQQERLATEARALVLRQRYVDLKIAYWRAVRDGDTARSEQVSDQARALADELRAVTHDPIH